MSILIFFHAVNGFSQEEKEGSDIKKGETSGEKKSLKDESDTITIIADEVDEIEKIRRTSTSVDIVPTGDAYQRVNSISEILSERAGIQVKRFGGLGSYSTVSIRGSNPNQVVIYLDGVPLNDAKFGEVNLENLSLDNLERIEIYRGFTPACFGISGIGGVINLVTKKTKEHSSTLSSASYGSYQTNKVTFSRSQKIKDFDYMIFFNRTESKGNFRFKDDNGTPILNTWDDRWVKRKNNQHCSYTATIKTAYNWNDYRISVMDDFFYKEQGLPGMSNNNVRKINSKTLRNIANLRAEKKKLFIKNINTNLNFFYSLKRDEFDNSYGEDIGIGGPCRQKGVFDNFGIDAHNEFIFPKAYQTFSLLLSYQRETYRGREKSYYTNYIEHPGKKQIRDRFSLTVEDELAFFNGILQITPQFRYEHWNQKFSKGQELFGNTAIIVGGRNYSDNFGGKGGVKIFPLKWIKKFPSSKKFPFKKHFFIKGNVGRNFRAPTFIELFGERGYIVGNVSLKPEKSFNWDVGCGFVVRKKFFIFDWFNIEYAYYDNTIDDVIIYIQNSQWTLKAQNVDEAEITGHEVSLSVSMFNHLILGGNYTLQKAIDKSEIPYLRGNYLPYRPVEEISASACLYIKRKKFFFDYASITYDFNYTGHNYRDQANSYQNYVKRRIIHNLLVKINPIKWITLSFEVKNLTDNQISDIVGYPLPGRSYYGTVSFHFSDSDFKKTPQPPYPPSGGLGGG